MFVFPSGMSPTQQADTVRNQEEKASGLPGQCDTGIRAQLYHM